MGWGRSCRYLRRPSHRTGSSNWSSSGEGESEVQNNMCLKTPSCTVKSLITCSCTICKTISCIWRCNHGCSIGLHKPCPFLLFWTHCTRTHANLSPHYINLVCHHHLRQTSSFLYLSPSLNFLKHTRLRLGWGDKKSYLPQSKHCLTSSPPPAVNVRYKVGLSRPANNQPNTLLRYIWLIWFCVTGHISHTVKCGLKK